MCGTGKPDIVALHDYINRDYSKLCRWANIISGQAIATNATKLAFTVHQPIGVVGQIMPWNFQLAMTAWKLGPALARANTVVLKPAEQTTLGALYLASLISKSGFTTSMVNVLNMLESEAGVVIVGHSDIDKVTFTGSTTTGRGDENGFFNTHGYYNGYEGKISSDIFDDADWKQAAAKLAHSDIIHNQGQVDTSRYVPHSTAQRHPRQIRLVFQGGVYTD